MEVKYLLRLLIDPEGHLASVQNEVNDFLDKLVEDGMTDIQVKSSLSTNTVFVPAGGQSGGVIIADQNAQQAMEQGTQVFLLVQVSWWPAEEESEDLTTKDTKKKETTHG